jgi:hypothetical protein
MIAGMLVPVKAPSVGNILGWVAASDFLVAAALDFAAMRCEWKGWRLGLALAAIPVGTTALTAIEGTVFLNHWDISWPRVIGASLVTYALVAPLWVMIFGRHNPTGAHYRPVRSESPGRRVWKFLASDIAYLVLYIIAGAIIFPFVKTFYATHMPSLGRIAAVQLLIRGPLLVCLCLLLVRMLGLPRLSGALAVGAVLSILNGVAPLLLPNPYLPDAVRWVHLGEISSSNFLFGVFVGWVWGQAKIPVHTISQAG